MKVYYFVLSFIISFLSISCSSQKIITHEELVELLAIKQWEVPMPKDSRYQWAFDIRDYKDYKIVEDNSEWMDPNRVARITFMPVGDNCVYRFWFQQNNTSSSGSTRIDVCDDPDNIEMDCEINQLETMWHKKPISIDDGKTYLICELKETFVLQRKKQVILYITKYKLNDM